MGVVKRLSGKHSVPVVPVVPVSVPGVFASYSVPSVPNVLFDNTSKVCYAWTMKSGQDKQLLEG